MSDNPIIEMRAFHTTHQERSLTDKPYWKTERTVAFLRADGVERVYGCRTIDIIDDELIETPALTKKQWRRLKRLYDRMVRRKAFEHETDYRPGRVDSGNRPYWELRLTRR